MSFFKNSYYYSDSAQRFAARINFNHSLIVAIKFYILYYKKTFMVFLIVNTIIFFGFLLKVKRSHWVNRTEWNGYLILL